MTASNWDKGRSRRLGMTLEQYLNRKAGGERYCVACDDWHPLGSFGRDSSRPEGRALRCKASEARRKQEQARRKPEMPKDALRKDVLHTVYSMLRSRRPHREIEDVIREAVGR